MKAHARASVSVPKGVLVTGATTPIGVAIVRRLLLDPEVKTVLGTGAEPPGRGLPLPDDPRLVYVQADLARSRGLRQLLFAPARDCGVELVIHSALLRNPARQGQRVHALNVECTRELLNLCDRHPTIRRFVYRSGAEVYRVRADLPALMDEEHPLELDPAAPQWLRDRVEADLTVCARIGTAEGLDITVLRCAECLGAGTGSQLYDYLQTRVCLVPAGFDPMLNVLSLPDLTEAVHRTLRMSSPARGIFNIPGHDTLPLSKVVAAWGRTAVPVPEFALEPLYRLRRMVLGLQFRYELNRWRFHFGGILDGRHAERVLGYHPHNGIHWLHRV